MLSVLSLVIKYAFDVLGKVFQIPFIDKSVNLPCFFIALNFCVRMVYDTDESNAPDREKAMDILFNKLQFPCESGLRLAKDNVKFACFRVL